MTAPAVPTLITIAQFRAFAPKCAVAAWAPALDAAARRFGITTPLRIAHWMAQMGEESGGFTAFAEDMTYRDPARLAAIFPRCFADGQHDPAEYVNNPKALASLVYAGMYGNRPGTTDGYDFRGGGPMQMTFRSAYADAAKALGRPYLDHPELVQQPDDGALTAAWLFAVYKNCLPAADRDDIVGVTRPLEPSLGAMDQRKAQLVRAKGIWKP